MPLAAAPVLASIIGGGASIGSTLLAGRGSGQARAAQQQLLQSQQALMGQQTALGKQLGGYASNLYNLSTPALGRALSYYQTLAGGNRGSINEVNAPQIAQMNDIYKGAANQIGNSTMTGGARDYANAELQRQRVGQLAMLPMQARYAGVGNLASLASNGLNLAGGFGGAASGALGNAGMTGANALNSATGIEGTQYNRFQQIGSNLANTFLPYILQQTQGKSGGSSASGGVQGNKPLAGGTGLPILYPTGPKPTLQPATASPYDPYWNG